LSSSVGTPDLVAPASLALTLAASGDRTRGDVGNTTLAAADVVTADADVVATGAGEDTSAVATGGAGASGSIGSRP
jgi:hypothetical protein